MSETSDDPPVSRRRPVRLRRAGLIVLVIPVVSALALWTQRTPIARGYIDRELARRGVPARYTIADLGLGRQRLTHVVIGDPARPDLVADWIETETGMGSSGPSLTGLRAGHVRMRGALVGGRVSLGAIDALLPASSGTPFALPAIRVDIADARMRLTTPQALVGLKLSGSGRLDGGFRGSLAAVGDRLTAGGCTAEHLAAVMTVSVAHARPHLVGPVRAGTVACRGGRMDSLAADMDVTLGAALDRWQGQARLTSGAARYPGVALASTGGTVSFAGGTAATQGVIALRGAQPRTAFGGARQIALDGTYRMDRAITLDGVVRMVGAAVSPAMRAGATGWSAALAATPVGPLAARIAQALGDAGQGFAADAAVALRGGDGRTIATLSRLRLASASGVRVDLAGGQGVTLGWPGGVRVDTGVAVQGGGLPSLQASLAQEPGGAMRGTVRIDRYAADGASLSLTPVMFSADASGATRIATRATLSGPIGDGSVAALTLPVAATWHGGQNFVIDPDCVPVAFDRLVLSGLAVDRSALTLCPVDGALVRIDRGRIGGGARIGAIRLAGRLGATPVALETIGATLRLADNSIAATGVTTRIGAGDRITRIDIAKLDGRIAGGAAAGGFAGAGGRIGTVPLLVSGAAGDWRFARGRLDLTGALDVRDAAVAARFRPLAARGIALGLANGRIGVTGALFEPTRNVKVADLSIVHALASGQGSADLTVAGLTFDDAFQPDLLTPLTFGVIADVKGAIAGSGHIAWTGTGVTSTGVFRTAGTDLAAAFGPVTGIVGEIRFTDLLSLQSAPGQVASVKTINPGIPVNDGIIRYQTYPGAVVLVDSGRWPFAGGTLTLDPTLLDFSAPAERRMTFHVAGMAAERFLQQFDFKNLDATGIFDGTLPMVFDASGGFIRGGSLKVRDGGGTLAYVGDLSQKDLGLWGNIAFQALKSLRYRSLGITMDGPLAGEMITAVTFAGISQGQGAKSNFLIRRLQRLPFVFNIRIKAPFRGLLDSAQSFYDPKRLVQRNLPSLIEQQDKAAAAPPPTPPIQPPASRIVP